MEKAPVFERLVNLTDRTRLIVVAVTVVVILAMLVGTALVYSLLFATGKLLYGELGTAAILFVVGIMLAFLLNNLWKKVGADIV